MVRKLIYGVAINDADYVVEIKETVGYIEGKRIQKKIWICPYYKTWQNMLNRCLSKSYQTKYPSYRGCYVASDWLKFSKFKAWMETQDWEGKHLDKDLLIEDNLEYCPDKCLFVDPVVNTFLTESTKARGEFPIGVSQILRKHKGGVSSSYRSQINISGKVTYLGVFQTPEEAHDRWLAEKLKQAKILADMQTDVRVAKALLQRYENYKQSSIDS